MRCCSRRTKGGTDLGVVCPLTVFERSIATVIRAFVPDYGDLQMARVGTQTPWTMLALLGCEQQTCLVYGWQRPESPQILAVLSITCLLRSYLDESIVSCNQLEPCQWLETGMRHDSVNADYVMIDPSHWRQFDLSVDSSHSQFVIGTSRTYFGLSQY